MKMTNSVCLCNTHVHRGTRIVAIILLILNVIGLAASLVLTLLDKLGEKETTKNGIPVSESLYDAYNKYIFVSTIINLVFFMIFIVTLILLIYGNRSRKPNFYWPYLIFMGFHLYVTSVVIFFTLIGLVFALAGLSILGAKAIGTAMTTIILVSFGIINVLVFIFMYYFFFLIVNRSRRVMIEEQEAIGSGYQPNAYYKQPVA